MGKLTGLLMIVAGVGTAAFVYPMMSSGGDQAERQLADVVSISTNGTAAKSAPIVIAPQAKPEVKSEATPGKFALAPFAANSPVTGVIPTTPAAQPLPSQAPVTVTRPVEIAQAPAALAPTLKVLPAKTGDETKVALTREIQRELKRVGCYAGDQDGTWNADTRSAMKTFIDRVNATLPTDGPDHILKTLVQGHPGNACGKSCPTGQGLSNDGRCLPTAILAQAVKKPNVREAARDVATPSGSAQATAANRAVTSGWDSRVAVNAAPAARTTPNTQAAVVAQAPSPLVVNTTPAAKAAEALPGRMAIGAPANTEPTPFRNESGPPSGSTIVLKPKVKTQKPIETAAISPSPAPSSSQFVPPPLGAIEASGAEPSAKQSVARAQAPSPERRAAPQSAPVYRVPPPPIRFVGAAYSPAPQRIYRDRPRFGPQIFRDLDRAGR